MSTFFSLSVVLVIVFALQACSSVPTTKVLTGYQLGDKRVVIRESLYKPERDGKPQVCLTTSLPQTQPQLRTALEPVIDPASQQLMLHAAEQEAQQRERLMVDVLEKVFVPIATAWITR